MPVNVNIKAVKSPCVRVCKFDGETGFCFGCYRTQAERRTWYMMATEEQIATLQVLELRKAKWPDLKMPNIISMLPKSAALTVVNPEGRWESWLNDQLDIVRQKP